MTRTSYWTAADALLAGSHIEIERPRGSRHPRFDDIEYPLDSTTAASPARPAATAQKSTSGSDRCPARTTLSAPS